MTEPWLSFVFQSNLRKFSSAGPDEIFGTHKLVSQTTAALLRIVWGPVRGDGSLTRLQRPTCT